MNQNTNQQFKKVAVLYGGPSAERDVSLVSGAAVGDALRSLGYNVMMLDPKDISDNGLAQFKTALKNFAPDVCFNALHGRFGEDGGVQEILEQLKIRYTHSGPAASRLAMDKVKTLNSFSAHDLPIARHEVFNQAAIRQQPTPSIARPLVIKPVTEGSSVGLYIIKAGDEFPDLSTWNFGDALVEEYIPGLELTSAVLEIDGVATALGVTELQPNRGVYDYQAKYQTGETTHVCPANIDQKIYQQCLAFALRAHQVIGAKGVSRTDFRYDPHNNRLALLEINTQPGMTNLSLVPEQAIYKGISFAQLVDYILAAAGRAE
ncbi:MAG: D-alanine--D-alanine ligase [Hydrotalea sp.]|nr:D-alanine--D-alanine ligase [Hydrotalea sp.]